MSNDIIGVLIMELNSPNAGECELDMVGGIAAFPAHCLGLPVQGGQFAVEFVADNGVGLPRDLDIRYTTSLGLQLVTTLVNQLDGTLELDDRGGTQFEITFPAAL